MKIKYLLAAGASAAAFASSAMASSGGSGCTVQAPHNNTVDGSSLWGDVIISGARDTTDCNVNQFSWNNFLYLVQDDENGHPRFMNMAPWDKALPASGTPSWTPGYTPLNGTMLNKSQNEVQAGDQFQLLDVAGRPVVYDIRINDVFYNYIADNKLYTQKAVEAQAAAFAKANTKDGIWVPPNATDTKSSSIEIKTSWRNFGANAADCPADVMHCEKDSSGIWRGLVGLHLVQKTPSHGEMIWASFEHVSNAPDCAVGGSNPIQKIPVNPKSNYAPFNVNKGITSIEGDTGWSFFNFSDYKTKGGDGKNCVYPQSPSVGTAVCLTDPNPSGDSKTWVKVNVCRTDQLPSTLTSSCDSANNPEAASCLNKSVVNALPKGIAGKWRNYMLIGSEYVFWGASGTGASTVGCWNYTDGQGMGYDCKGTSDENTVTLRGSTSLANTTMETWMQKNIHLQTASLGFTLVGQDCFTCHQPATVADFSQGFAQGDLSHLFGRVSQKGSTSKSSE